MAIEITVNQIDNTGSSDSQITIERMRESDLDEVLTIERISFSMPWTRKMFETELNESDISYPFVARWIGTDYTEFQGKICGYTVFWHVVDEIHIGNIAVLPSFRRLGIASVLIKKIIHYAQEWQVKQVTLEVRVSNEPAIRLYHQFNFRELALRKKYYTNPVEDALVMVKDDF